MGPLLCLLSAAGFGAMAIFGKLAYDAGVEVGDLLLVRFTLAAALLLAVAAGTGALRGLSRRAVLAALAHGRAGIRHAVRAVLPRAGADGRLAAGARPLHLPGAGVRRRGRARARAALRARAGALLVASAGVALVLAGAASGSVDALGTAMGLGAALAYTVYILTGDRVLAGVPFLPLTALVCTGAAGRSRRWPGDRRARARFRRRRLGLGRSDRAGQHGRRDPDVLRRARSRGPLGGLDPVDPGARGHRGARGGGVRRDAVGHAAGGGALVLAAVAAMQWPARAPARRPAPAPT